MGIRDILSRLRKKDDIIVDLADLQKRGIIKPRKNLTEDMVDLTPVPASSEKTSSSDSDGSSALGFLGTLAGSVGTSPTDSPAVETETSTASASVSNFSYSERRQKLKGILRDLKNKTDSTTDRVYKLAEKIDLLERKIERLERRAGI